MYTIFLAESCIWIYFISVAYASLYHWNCGRTQRKAATINQLACPSYSLYVQLLWYPMYYPGGMKARVRHVQWSKPYSILAPTQDSNPGGRIQNHERWPPHYHRTQSSARVSLMSSLSTKSFYHPTSGRFSVNFSLVSQFDPKMLFFNDLIWSVSLI